MATTLSYLDRLLNPITDAFTPEMAKVIVNLRADSELESRIQELRTKSNLGTLSPQESEEYQEFVEAVDIISIIQSKARQFLEKHVPES